MLTSEYIDKMYKYFSESGADSMFTGVREKQFHWIGINNKIENGVKPINYNYKKRPRRQDFEGIIAENGACYINSVKNIKHDYCRLSGKIQVFELPAYTAYEIDELDDWLIIEELMKKLNY